jgi:hypothetical protein
MEIHIGTGAMVGGITSAVKVGQIIDEVRRLESEYGRLFR